jgi:hypothetical protein
MFYYEANEECKFYLKTESDPGENLLSQKHGGLN